MMTTEKQIKANQANAKKSTGANTPEGKAVVASNAIKHGLFASRLILPNESIDEYHQLLDSLIQSLAPYGALEQLLVEKIAVAAWKQFRLTRAESASIELDRRTEQKGVRAEVTKALNISWRHELKDDDFLPVTDEETEQLKWCGKVMREYLALLDSVLEEYQLDLLEKHAPEIFDQLKMDYGQLDNLAFEMQEAGTSLHEWATGLNDYCVDYIATHARKPLVQSIAEKVQEVFTAPISNELMMRYQAALDGELYKAIEALRKQQEHRHRVGITYEAEAD